MALLGCGRAHFDLLSDGNGSDDASTADAMLGAAPRCMVPARPDVSTPRVTLGCDPILAISEVSNGGVIRFDCPTGIAFASPMLVNQDTVIDGRGVVFDGQDAIGVMRVGNNARLTLLDVTIKRGGTTDTGAAVHLDSGALVAYDSSFIDNHAPAVGNLSGGAIAAIPALATVEIYGGRFIGNTAANGGAISAYAGLVVMNAMFDKNEATGTGGPSGSGGSGGAVHFVGPNDATFCGVSFTSNRAGDAGGAFTFIATDSASQLVMTDVMIDSNVGATSSAAYVQGAMPAKLRRVSITQNVATSGGGLWLQGPGTVDGENVSVIANRSDGSAGAGLYTNGVTGTFAFTTVADNLGNCPGCVASAIFAGSTVDLRATVIDDNTAQGTPAVCSETSTNSGAVWQWPGDLPLCATGATVTDPLLLPRGFATGPAGTLYLRQPSSGSPLNAAVASGCPAEDVLGRPRSTPCAAGAFEPL